MDGILRQCVNIWTKQFSRVLLGIKFINIYTCGNISLYIRSGIQYLTYINNSPTVYFCLESFKLGVGRRQIISHNKR